MSQIVRADTTKTFDQLHTELEDAVPALKPVPSDVPAMPGLGPPMQSVYSLSGEEGMWAQVEAPDSLSEDEMTQVRGILEG